MNIDNYVTWLDLVDKELKRRAGITLAEAGLSEGDAILINSFGVRDEPKDFVSRFIGKYDLEEIQCK